jgi:hypothetical protein
VFQQAAAFNSDVSKWNVSRVVAGFQAFHFAESFNHTWCSDSWHGKILDGTLDEAFVGTISSTNGSAFCCSAGEYATGQRFIGSPMASISTTTNAPSSGFRKVVNNSQPVCEKCQSGRTNLVPNLFRSEQCRHQIVPITSLTPSPSSSTDDIFLFSSPSSSAVVSATAPSPSSRSAAQQTTGPTIDAAGTVVFIDPRLVRIDLLTSSSDQSRRLVRQFCFLFYLAISFCALCDNGQDILLLSYSFFFLLSFLCRRIQFFNYKKKNRSLWRVTRLSFSMDVATKKE